MKLLRELSLLLLTPFPITVQGHDHGSCALNSAAHGQQQQPLSANNHECHGQTNLYAIQATKGKGLGVFALRDIDIGTPIMRESPVLKIKPPHYEKGTGYPMAEIAQLLRADFANLTAEQQEEVMSLAYYSTDAQLTSSDPLALIFKTNAYKSGDEIGLFPRIARINHSCRPNTSYRWQGKTNTRVMYANRKIMKGEEIMDSYISLLLPAEERQKLLDPYGFNCTCDVCTASAPVRKESDIRRMKIKQSFSDFNPHLDWERLWSRKDKTQAKKNAKESIKLVDLVKQEGLADYFGTAARIAALTHATAADWQAATVWANKGYEWRVMEDPDSPYAAEMHELTAKLIERWKHDLKSKNLLKKGV